MRRLSVLTIVLALCVAVAARTLAAPGDLLLKLEDPEPDDTRFNGFELSVAVAGKSIAVGKRGWRQRARSGQSR